jgi:hypothetical protein
MRKGREVAAIAAIHDEREAGTSHLFLMERRGARYRVTGRALLDVSDFRGASWTAESVDVDGDGYDEVLCTGTNARGAASGCRLVLYVPRTRRTYTLRLDTGAQEGVNRTQRAKWSPNALTRTAAPYRTALRQRARTLIASAS